MCDAMSLVFAQCSLSECPINSPIIVGSWFLLKLSNSQTFFSGGLFGEAISPYVFMNGLPLHLVFLIYPAPDHFSAIFRAIPRAG
jgi:hypothetical protein